MIPGSNLLAQAGTVIAFQTVDYLAATGRTLDAAGVWVTTYAAPTPVRGSFQSINTNLYERLGLDYQKSYRNFYSVDPVYGTTRDRSGDRVQFFGRTYEAVGGSDWRAQDGWQGTLFVDVGPTA